MRVCHVMEAGGGVGNVVIDLARLGLQAGDDVTVIYAPARAWPNFVESLSALPGLKLITVPMHREVGFHDIWDCVRLWNALRRAGPFDIIQAHSSKAGALARIAGIFFPKSVKVYTPHAFMTMAPGASKIYGWIEWALSWLCDAIICVSEQEKWHAYKTLKIPAEKLYAIPNGVALDVGGPRAPMRQRLGFGDQEYVVGFVGRLVEQKNPSRLIETFAIAAAQRSDLRLAIVGEGPLDNVVKQAISAQKLNDRVRFLAAYDGRSLMGGFDCLVCSSDYESFGLVILEALAAGVPVVTTPVGIAEEAIVSGETGCVTKDFSAKSLAEGILKLAALDTPRRGQMAQAAKIRAQNYTVERMAQRTRALYGDLIEQRGIA